MTGVDLPPRAPGNARSRRVSGIAFASSYSALSEGRTEKHYHLCVFFDTFARICRESLAKMRVRRLVGGLAHSLEGRRNLELRHETLDEWSLLALFPYTDRNFSATLDTRISA